MRKILCLIFVIILNHEQLASTKVFFLFFISRTIVIHVGLRKHGIRELTLYLLLCFFIGTQYTHFSFFILKLQ